MGECAMSEVEQCVSKPEGYFETIPWELVGLVDPGNNIILDIGCGTGNTGEALTRAGKAKQVFGIELVATVAEMAKMKMDGVIVGDVEAIGRLPFAPETFDYIIAGDVLEHLKDPWRALERLRVFVKAEGFIIASIPNVRNWRIIKDLVFKGEWRYVEAGILDNTHLRFFTKKTIVDMFTSCGYEVITILPRLRKRSHRINRLSLGLFEEFLAGQYMCKARKAAG